jgi:hypothetical protein
VTALQVFPEDLKRLNQAVAAMTPRDFDSRKAWASWAEKRGKSFKDDALIQRAREIQAEALRIEADQRRKSVDAPSEWLALAEDGRKRGVPEPEPSALAHKAFRSRLASTGELSGLKELVAAIERFFPGAAGDKDAARTNLAKWNQPYANDPEGAYRGASGDERKALDRRLWVDAREKLMRAEVASDPATASKLAAQAETELPERPALAAELMVRGLSMARQDLGSLRLGEVKSMGAIYREKLNQPDKELQLYQDWLKAQKERLSPTDAEGPLYLATLYEQLLNDKTAAVEMLRRAWKIDPGSKTIAEAFRTRGYRRQKDDWVEAIPERDTESAAQGAEQTAAGSRPQSLRGKTPDEVRQILQSKPDHKVMTGVKGQLIEQWIVSVPNQRQLRYINFLHSPDSLQPRVIADYILPRPATWDRSLAP